MHTRWLLGDVHLRDAGGRITHESIDRFARKGANASHKCNLALIVIGGVNLALVSVIQQKAASLRFNQTTVGRIARRLEFWSTLDRGCARWRADQ